MCILIVCILIVCITHLDTTTAVVMEPNTEFGPLQHLFNALNSLTHTISCAAMEGPKLNLCYDLTTHFWSAV